MTKKDYVLIADSIVEWYNSTKILSRGTLTSFINIMSIKLKYDNHKFDSKVFIDYIIKRT